MGRASDRNGCAAAAVRVTRACDDGRTMGTITAWPEDAHSLFFAGDAVDALVSPESTDLTGAGFAQWSVADSGEPTGGGSGWFRSNESWTEDVDLTLVAAATGDMAELTDAASLDFSQESVGPISEGSFLVFHNQSTQAFLVLRLDRVRRLLELSDLPVRTGECSSLAELDATWYLLEDGTGDFTRFVE